MNENDIRMNAERIIEKADRLLALTKKEGWNDFVEILDILLSQEIRGLAGQDIDKSYYRKIGFLKMTAFIRALPGILQDKKVCEFLTHQGQAKAIETIKGIPFLYQKQKKVALDQLQQILGGANLENLRKATAEETFKQS